MKKKEPSYTSSSKPSVDASSDSSDLSFNRTIVDPRLPQDAQDKLKSIQSKLEVFRDKLIAKFEGYISGIALLPPNQPDQSGNQQGEQPSNPNAINVLVLIDDTDSQRMTKEELKDKLSSVISNIASDVDKNLVAQTVIYSELWQQCYDAKYELLQLIAMSAPVYDNGMLSAVKIAEVHKSMVLKKFERYIVSYVLAGSLVQGKATATSDIDVFIVIDDTDVKKMTRIELKDKLRAIIIGMGAEAGQITGIKNKINIQVYILTDFWDSIKEANPVIFTFLRDGVPFFDRGIFMPWKQLLRMGRIRPSMEAIDIYMSSGSQALDRVTLKLKEIGMEDFFWSTLTPSQATLMLHGIPPPTPKETPGVMRDIFVKKEKLLEDKYVKILEKIIKIRKDLEHGSRTKIEGHEIDTLHKEATQYLKRMDQLASAIAQRKNEEDVIHTYESLMGMIRDILATKKLKQVKEKDLINVFDQHIVATGEMPKRVLRDISTITKAKLDYESKKLTKAEIERVRILSQELMRTFVEYIQRARGIELERTKVRVKHGNAFGEVILLDKVAFIIHNIDDPGSEISKAAIDSTGCLTSFSPGTLEELEHAIATAQIPSHTFIKHGLFRQLPEIFGADVEVLIHK